MSMSAAETRLLLAMARYLSNDGEHAPSIFDVEDALKAVEATGENAKENGGAPPSKTGAGGGDPLPQPENPVDKAVEIIQRSIEEVRYGAPIAEHCRGLRQVIRERESDLARLSRVHHQLRENLKELAGRAVSTQAIIKDHKQGPACLGYYPSWVRLSAVQDLLAASTTETPP